MEPYLTVRETIARNAGYYPTPRDVDEVIGAGRPRRAGAAQGPRPLRRAEAPPGPGAGDDRQPRPCSSSTSRPPGSTRTPGGARGSSSATCATPGHHRAHHALHGGGAGTGRPGGGDVGGQIVAKGPTASLGGRDTALTRIAFTLPDGCAVGRPAGARRRSSRRAGHASRRWSRP